MNTSAIDIGGTKISAALVSRNNQLTQHTRITTPSSASPKQLYDALVAIITLLKPHAYSVAVVSKGIICNGICTALNPDNKDFPLKETLSTLTGLLCWLFNDAQAATWAEYDYRRETISDIAFITVLTGVGGGVIQQGQLFYFTGKRGIAGHLGHTLADPHGSRCGCGRYGCVEAIASGCAIAAQATGELAGKNAKAIFEAFHQVNSQAKSIIERSANTIANLVTDIKQQLMPIVSLLAVVLGWQRGISCSSKQT